MNKKEQPKPSIFYYFGGQSPANLASIRRNIAKKVGVHPRSVFFALFGNNPHILYYSFDGLNKLDYIRKDNAIVRYIIQMGEEIKPSECVGFSKLKDLRGVNIETRIGEKVRILCTDVKNSAPVVAAITTGDDKEDVRFYNKDGKLSTGSDKSGVFYDLVCYENIPQQKVFIKPKEGYPPEFVPIELHSLESIVNILNGTGTEKKLCAVQYLRGSIPISLKDGVEFVTNAIREGRINVFDKNGIFVKEYVIDF